MQRGLMYLFLYESLFCSVLASLQGMHAGSQFPNKGYNLCHFQWKRRVLLTGLPGNFHKENLNEI